MLVQRRRRCTNIKTTSGERVVFMCDQQTRYIDPLLVLSRVTVADGAPTPAQNWMDISHLLGYSGNL